MLGAGDDLFLGSAGNNYLYAGAGNDSAYGGSGVEVFSGEAGDDWLSGGDGQDGIYGGDGDDWLEGGAAQDLLSGGDGADVIHGGLERDNIDGSDGNDSLYGDESYDRMYGSDGEDFLDGGTGLDTMEGGHGDDTFIVNAVGDLVIELGGGGTDTVLSKVSYTLTSEVEILILTGTAGLSGTGNWLDNTVTGTVGRNVLDGGIGADTLTGGRGNDTYHVDQAGDVVVEYSGEGRDLIYSTISLSLAGMNVEDLTLAETAALNATGNAAVNMLTGNARNNLIDGGMAADTLAGGLGDDTYIVDASGDMVVENVGEGLDTVVAYVSYTLGEHVDSLVLNGSSGLGGTGNGLNNAITGTAFGDALNDGSGSDTMRGGLGNDTYYVDVAGDLVIERNGEGTDTIYATVSYALRGHVVENLILTGTANLNATGNALGNTLTGNDGNNVLNGMAARDVLTGGLGADVFLFTAGSGKDRITDFNAVQNDMIDISAYTGGIVSDGRISQVGGNVVITLDVDNIVTVLSATQADVLSHIVW